MDIFKLIYVIGIIFSFVILQVESTPGNIC